MRHHVKEEHVSDLKLSLAMGNYDRTRAIVDGRVKIDGVDPVPMLLSPEEMFFRAFRHEAAQRAKALRRKDARHRRFVMHRTHGCCGCESPAFARISGRRHVLRSRH